MQKLTLILIFFFLSLSLNAQQFSLEFGKVISSFDYKNSDGEELDNMQGSTNNHLGIGFKMPIRKTSAYLLSLISYNKYGAQGSDDVLGNYYDWNINYVGISIGGGYEFFKLGSYKNVKNTNTDQGFTVYVQLFGAVEFLVQGTQTINDQVYNLIGVEQFDKPYIFARGGLGVKYYASKTISLYAEYMGGRGFSVFKSDSNENLNINAHTISLGIAINMPKRK